MPRPLLLETALVIVDAGDDFGIAAAPGLLRHTRRRKQPERERRQNERDGSSQTNAGSGGHEVLSGYEACNPKRLMSRMCAHDARAWIVAAFQAGSPSNVCTRSRRACWCRSTTGEASCWCATSATDGDHAPLPLIVDNESSTHCQCAQTTSTMNADLSAMPITPWRAVALQPLGPVGRSRRGPSPPKRRLPRGRPYSEPRRAPGSSAWSSSSQSTSDSRGYSPVTARSRARVPPRRRTPFSNSRSSSSISARIF